MLSLMMLTYSITFVCRDIRDKMRLFGRFQRFSDHEQTNLSLLSELVLLLNISLLSELVLFTLGNPEFSKPWIPGLAAA